MPRPLPHHRQSQKQKQQYNIPHHEDYAPSSTKKPKAAKEDGEKR
jgi:hypothetical protein